MSYSSKPILGSLDEARDRSLEEDVRRLAEEARTLAEAEVRYQKSRALFAGQEVKALATLGIIAAAVLFFAVMGLVMGLLLALTPIIGAWAATAVVVGALLAVVAICALVAFARFKRMKSLLSEEGTGS